MSDASSDAACSDTTQALRARMRELCAAENQAPLHVPPQSIHIMDPEETPPPWAYNVPPDYMTISVSDHDLQSKGFEKYPYPSAAFLDTSAKCSLHNFVKDTGDPGAYDTHVPMSTRSIASFNHRVASGSAAFGSLQARDAQHAMRARTGDCHSERVAYDYDHMYAIGGVASRTLSPRRLATSSRRAAAPRRAALPAQPPQLTGQHECEGSALVSAAAAKLALIEARAAARRPSNTPDTRTAAFRSTSPSASSYVRKSETPGVGEYECHDTPNKVGAKTMVTPTHSISRYGSSVFAPVEGARRRDEPIRTGVSPRHGTRQPSPRQAVSLSKDRLGMDPCCHMNPRLKTLEPHLAPGTYTPKEGSIKESVAAKVNPRSPGFGSSSVRHTDPAGSAKQRMYGGGSL